MPTESYESTKNASLNTTMGDDDKEIRVVVAIDFGTTCSGFAYAHVVNPNITSNEKWPGPNNSVEITPRVFTALQYDKDLKVVAWGAEAMAKEPEKSSSKHMFNREPENITVENFKLLLASHIPPEKKHEFPKNLHHQQAIKDFLEKMLPLIRKNLSLTWPDVKFSQTKFVFSVPAEWRPEHIGAFKECISRAGYPTNDRANLEFTPEPEAAALYCMEKLEYELKEGDTILICDCGGGTVDLTMRTLLPEKKFRKITPRIGGFCGSTYVDANFSSFLEGKVGTTAIESLKKNHYGEYQYLIQKFFCPRIKFGFTGVPSDFKKPISLDIERNCPKLMNYVTNDFREALEEEDWLIEIKYDDVLKMFDPVIKDIVKLIREQLVASPNKCSVIFLVGGFAGSTYLVNRIKKEFEDPTVSDDKLKVSRVCVPPNPITSVVCGGVMYGLKKGTVKSRILTHHFGIRIYPRWKKGVDPKNEKHKFDCLAKRSQEVGLDEPCSRTYYPIQLDQDEIRFKVCYTSKPNVLYYDDSELKSLGELKIKLPDTDRGLDRPVVFSLMFGELDVTATAYIETNHETYTATFRYPKSNSYFEPTTDID